MCRCNFRSWRADVVRVCRTATCKGRLAIPSHGRGGRVRGSASFNDALGSLAGRLPFGQAPRAEATALPSCPSLFAGKEACHVVSVP